jgi:hypothetical protein
MSERPRHRVEADGFDPVTGGFQHVIVDGERFSANEVGSWRLRIRRLKRQRDAAEKVARDLRDDRDHALALLAATLRDDEITESDGVRPPVREGAPVPVLQRDRRPI